MFKINYENVFGIISIELTHKCNLSCEWCFNQHSPWFDRKNEINYEDLLKILLIFEKFRRKNWLQKPLIKLTWWEPLLYYKIKEIIIFIKKYLWYKIKLNTNWFYLESLWKNFIEDNIDIILFSYHFWDKTLYNQKYILDKNKYSNYISSLNWVKKYISSRINKNLINDIDNHINFISSNFSFNKYFLWFPVLWKWEKLDFTKEDFRNFCIKLNKIKSKIWFKFEIWFPPAFCFSNEPELLNSLVNMKNITIFLWERININPKWKITSSYYYFDKEYKIVNEEDFEQFLNSTFFSNIRKLDWLDEKCKNCDYLIKCWWWNRMLALSLNWDFFSRDPWMT